MDIGFLSKLTTKTIFRFIEVIVLNCIIILDSVIYMGMDRDIKKLLREIFCGNRTNAVDPAGCITIQNAGQPAVIYNAP